MIDFWLQLSGILVGWAITFIFAYLMVRWCLDFDMSWKKIFIWAAYMCAGIIISMILLYLLPERFRDIFNLFINYLMCGTAIHILLLRLESYLSSKYKKTIPKLKLSLSILLMYLVMAINMLVVIKLNSHVLVELSHVAVIYVLRVAILMCLVLEIKLRRIPTSAEIEDYFEESL